MSDNTTLAEAIHGHYIMLSNSDDEVIGNMIFSELEELKLQLYYLETCYHLDPYPPIL